MTLAASYVCPNCGTAGMSVFYEVRKIPVHDVQQLKTREDAIHFPTGDVVLGHCANCGFVSNVVFDPTPQDYSHEYEATQSYSPTFNVFANRLASRLIEQYDLHGKDIIEIGCGQGEFLISLCEMGGNRGVGFDPAYVTSRPLETEAQDRLTFIPDYYSEKYTDYKADFICCKMTLEHIHNTAEFVSTVRRSIGDKPNAIVFFQVPNALHVFKELGFWDVYYEHCSYFSLGSLARLFRKCGFDVIHLDTDYDDQYLLIEARPSSTTPSTAPALPEENDLLDIAETVANFSKNVRVKLDSWKQQLQEMKQNGQKVVIWGGGSKGVAFLTTLRIHDEILYAVDINPRKHGMYMAGTGQEIVSPEFLRQYQPDVVIVMNPVYCDEVGQSLQKLGVNAKLMTV